jgi:glycosyltransferase involved in cell wall biosynthesis
MHHADVGVVVAAGDFSHNNESTKIYHYLRAGLPVVSESGFPNDAVVSESRLGFVVANGDQEAMAEKVIEATRREWDRDAAMRYILANHTWERRVETYAEIFARHFPRLAA